MTSGMGFPGLDTAIARERVARAEVRTPRGTSAIRNLAAGEKALRLSSTLKGPGVAVFTVELKPRSLELTAEDVKLYLEEIGATASIGPIWEAMPEPRRWRESYVKHAKTYVRVGASGNHRRWAEPAGMALEFVPRSDPTILRGGDRITFVLLENGAPVRSFPVGLLREGSEHATDYTTDENGSVELTLPQSGRYLLRATKLRQSTRQDLDWESDFSTVTFEVQAK